MRLAHSIVASWLMRFSKYYITPSSSSSSSVAEQDSVLASSQNQMTPHDVGVISLGSRATADNGTRLLG